MTKAHTGKQHRGRYLLVGVLAPFALLALWCGTPFVRIWWGYDRVAVAAEAFSRSHEDSDLQALVAMIHSGGLRGSNAAAFLKYMRREMSTVQIKRIIVPALIEGLRHEDGFVRSACVNTLDSSFSDYAAPALPELGHLLSDTFDSRMPIWSAELIAKLKAHSDDHSAQEGSDASRDGEAPPKGSAESQEPSN
jgi:hypothetical protein